MSDSVIIVENLSKKYRIRHQQRERYTALRDVIANKFAAPFRWLSSDLGPLTSNVRFPTSGLTSDVRPLTTQPRHDEWSCN